LHWIADGGAAWRRGAEALSIGINYGQIGDNLPSPSRVSYLLRSMQVSKVKLYDADPSVLSAFLDTDVEFVVGIGNENVSAMAADPAAARAWVQRHVQGRIQNGAAPRAELLIHVQNSLILLPRSPFV
jgi:hypothetical protein